MTGRRCVGCPAGTERGPGVSDASPEATFRGTTAATYSANAWPFWNSTKAVEFSVAIQIPDIGINLSGQTGWDTNGMIQYWMGSHSHHICGGKDVPGGDPKVLDVGQ